MNKRFSIPSTFELCNEMVLNNPDFHLVKVRIMSSGENYNGSSFTINSLNNAKDSVAYTPVLANIVKNDNDEWDYNGHDINTEFKIDYNGNMTIVEEYIEKPVGVFLNNSTEIKYDEELNVNYIQAYAVLWETYSRAVDILKRDGVKDVSVEIEVMQGEMREDGYYEIQEYNILGTTLLGNGILPAIEGSKIEMCFSKDTGYEDNLKEIDKLLKAFALKGGEEVEENKIEQPQEELEFQEEVVEELAQSVENEQIVYEEEEEKEEICPECNKPIEECVCEEEEKEEEFSQEEVVEEIEEVEEKLYSQSELDTIVSNVRDEYSQLVEELESLREFKNEYDRQVKLQELEQSMDELASNFNVENDVLKELKEKVVNGEYSMDKFELELYRHNSPVKKEFNKKESNKLPVIDNKNKMSDVDLFFDRYNVPKRK